MNENRLPDYLEHMQQAAKDACSFVDGLGKDDFLADKRTQQAVIMSLIIMGEAATKVMEGYVKFTEKHASVPWRNMRGMRNRIAHGYFDINLDVVWDTVQTALPELLKQLPSVCNDASGRKRQMTDSKIESAKKLLATGVPPRDVAKNLGVSVPTLYRWIPASAQA